MKNRINHSNCEFINPIEVEVRLDAIMIRKDIKAGLGQTMHTGDIQDIVKIIEAGPRYNSNSRGSHEYSTRGNQMYGRIIMIII